MKPLHVLRRWISWFGARRWRKEVLLAIVLTLAAAVFLASSLVGSDVSEDARAPVSTAHKPQQ
jgi:hypothetical protein